VSNLSEDWDFLFESGEFIHWEPYYPSPELSALVATRNIDKRDRILDVGTGGGLDAIFLAQYKFDVVGVDFSKASLAIAQKRAKELGVKVDWRLGTVFDLPVESGSIDFVVDRGLFHVIDDVDRPKYASEISRVLKLQGRVLIRGASKQTAAQDRFNPITEQAIDKYFPTPKFERGLVVPIPLFSKAGVLDGRIVCIRKVST